MGARVRDWSAPWLQPLRHVGQPVDAAWQSGVALHDTLNRACGAPVRFVPQGDLPAGLAYEQFVFDSGSCPVREGLHDFFNGLCWLHFPRTKARLNRLQASEIAVHGIQADRGAVRDAITLFDENAALLHAPQALWQALLAKDWQRLFVDLRPLWAQAQLVLFGHALLEKLAQPRKAITAHVYPVQIATNSIAELDAWLSADLSAEKLAGKPFAPLSVLGVPGWWPANEDARFYADSQVFRSPRA
jgi:hypothetical protein